MKRRNPQELNEHLAPGTVCQLYGGFEDGSKFLVPDTEHVLLLETVCGKVKRFARYVRQTPTRFCFEGYQ
jgi:hypothetical protein